MAARWLWLLALCTGPAAAPPPPDAEVTFVLPAGRRECFYQGAPGNASLEAEYQVPEGAGAELYRRGRGLHRRGRGLYRAGNGRAGPVTEGLRPGGGGIGRRRGSWTGEEGEYREEEEEGGGAGTGGDNGRRSWGGGGNRYRAHRQVWGDVGPRAGQERCPRYWRGVPGTGGVSPLPVSIPGSGR